jgi:16S rRNA (guanine966-N2)-methyltransferase
MVEKARAALFDVVGPVTGFSVLDVYAGSGAVGFEAASRGAVLVESIESNQRVARTIQANLASLGLQDAYIPRIMSLQTWLAAPAQNPPSPRYDLIIADPPHRLLDPRLLERLVPYVKATGVLALGLNGKIDPPHLAGAPLVTSKNYGDVALAFYQPSS